MKNDECRLIALSYHRNGVCGEGFDVVLFDWKDPAQTKLRRMVAIVFGGEGRVAVLDAAETMAGNIAFAGGNSWRGDRFELWLRKQIDAALG